MGLLDRRVWSGVLLAAAGAAFAQGVAPVAAPKFEIRAFVIEGNTLLPQQEIDRIVAPSIGASRDFGDVQRALEALQDAYTNRGYTAVRVLVPEQDIRVGQVRLQVVEAALRRVRIEGNQFFDSANVRRSLPSLREGRSPNTVQASENLQLANENPAKATAVALEAADDDDAKVDAVVRVSDDKPSKFTVFLDNTGTSQTGYYRTGIGYQHANLFNRDHVLNAQYITSPTQVDDVTIVGLGYRIPYYPWNGAFDFVAGHSDVNSGTVQNLFNVSGAGTVLGARYTQLLPRVGTYEQRVSLGWDYRAFQQNVTLVGTTLSLIPDVTVRPVTLGYTGRVAEVGRDASFFASYSQNIPGSGDASQAAFTAQRAGARASYDVWRAGASLTQALPQDLLVRAALNGQYTRDLLITGEQFGMGGADSVRGFLERETANDIGHRLSLELYSPDFGSRVGQNWRVRGLGFFDMARGRDQSPARGPNNGLSSAGLGVRANAAKSLSFRADWARVIDAAGTRPSGKDRVHFAVAYSF